jgi:hypothetical protein
MKNKIFALFVLTAFILSAVALIFADTKTSKTNNELVGLLPASDMVVTLDAQRLFNQALPQVLSANQEMLAEINAHIDTLKSKTGLDARQFQQVAVGLTTKQISAKDVEFEPFVLARGSFNSGALLAVAKMASNGKYREEKIGSRTIYIFTPKEIIEANKPSTKNSFLSKILDKVTKNLTREVAVTTYDDKTLAFGTPARVREAFETKTRIATDVLGLVNRNPNAVISFGGRMPNGMSAFLPFENDELGKNLDSIRQVSGGLNIGDGSAALSVTAKTLKDEQAQGLKETMEGLQVLGKAFLGGSKSADKQVYARMVENAKISRSGSEVSFDLQVPQTDIDVIISKK